MRLKRFNENQSISDSLNILVIKLIVDDYENLDVFNNEVIENFIKKYPDKINEYDLFIFNHKYFPMSFANDNGVIRILNPTEFREKLGLSSSRNIRQILRDAIPNYDSVILKYESKYENPYDKVRRLYPKLARREDGNRFYFLY